DEILELYLNHIYFGSGAYGVEAAARNYFDKSAAELRLSEAALLAAMPRSPVLYNPRRYGERARARRDLVLSMMAEQGHIDEGDARAARDTPLRVRRDPPARPADGDLIAPYFVEAVRRRLEDRLGETIYTTRLQVYTTLDRRAQRIAERELERQLDVIEGGRYGAFEADRYRADGQEEPTYLQGAIVVLEAGSGDVRALVGGRDYAQSRFDRATRARRQAGSAFKPFVYATAIAQGFAPSQRIKDDTLRMDLDDGEVWEPHNYSGEFQGFVSMREALVSSLNVPTIRLAQDVGLDNIERLARDAGVRSDIPDVPSAAIGAAEVTVLELTAAYTAFANLGVAVEPRLVARAIDDLGITIWENEIETDRVLQPEVAWLVTDMLSDAVDAGTASAVRDAGFRSAAAGKTGTTNDGADVWFVGYTPDLMAGVWLGFDRPHTILQRATGGRLAAPVWARVMRGIYEERPTPQVWT
ncbi:MAG: transglycosylase domain-containing protein, partial [Longimicrobiales bacterium]